MKCSLYFVCSGADGIVINTINVLHYYYFTVAAGNFACNTCIACCMMSSVLLWKKPAVLLQ